MTATAPSPASTRAARPNPTHGSRVARGAIVLATALLVATAGVGALTGTAAASTSTDGVPALASSHPGDMTTGAGNPPDDKLMRLINDARQHPEKWPPMGNTAGATMTGCKAFQSSTALHRTAADHNTLLKTLSKAQASADAHQTGVPGVKAWSDGGPIARAGFNRARSENVAFGQSGSPSAVAFWMQHDAEHGWGHRNAILNCAYKSAGADFATGGPWGHYYTLDMGTR